MPVAGGSEQDFRTKDSSLSLQMAALVICFEAGALIQELQISEKRLMTRHSAD